ncbi:hypothetical protein Fmac_011770 [Flemingia macrophylla]|uniref:Ethylene insensitive 3-like DNA-binding domain-containing protein n=1 Tax=Flemingia macrophylla TaxID=520843 RepID=A0ABD1MNG2_9FABA
MNQNNMAGVGVVELDPSTGDTSEEETSDGEEEESGVTIEELETRMWRDRMLLRRLKDERREREKGESVEMLKKKALTRAQDTVLKSMLKMMEVCDVRGFVYGIIPDKGKPVSGASDNLRAWWKDRVRFDRNGPAAILRPNLFLEPNGYGIEPSGGTRNFLGGQSNPPPNSNVVSSNNSNILLASGGARNFFGGQHNPSPSLTINIAEDGVRKFLGGHNNPSPATNVANGYARSFLGLQNNPSPATNVANGGAGSSLWGQNNQSPTTNNVAQGGAGSSLGGQNNGSPTTNVVNGNSNNNMVAMNNGIAMPPDHGANKRKARAVQEITIPHEAYSCHNLQCPYHNTSFGFNDRNVRTNHLLACRYKGKNPVQVAAGGSMSQIGSGNNPNIRALGQPSHTHTASIVNQNLALTTGKPRHTATPGVNQNETLTAGQARRTTVAPGVNQIENATITSEKHGKMRMGSGLTHSNMHVQQNKSSTSAGKNMFNNVPPEGQNRQQVKNGQPQVDKNLFGERVDGANGYKLNPEGYNVLMQKGNVSTIDPPYEWDEYNSPSDASTFSYGLMDSPLLPTTGQDYLWLLLVICSAENSSIVIGGYRNKDGDHIVPKLKLQEAI